MEIETKELITKAAKIDLSVEDGKREVVATISTETVDRDCDVMLAKGCDLTAYRANPVVLFNHDYDSPIGKCLWIKATPDGIVAKYYISDKTEQGQELFGLIQDGVLSAHSIGFRILDASPPTPQEIKAHPDWADCRRVVRKWELNEFSVVAVPCNPEALAMMVSKGIRPDTIKLFTPEVTDTPAPVEPAPVETKEQIEIDLLKKILGTLRK